MGYYTYFTVDVIGFDGEPVDNATLIKMGNDLNKISGEYFTSVYDVDTINDLVSYESYKWYDHTEDMLALSRLYPNYRFDLYGEGEERDDNWIEHYKNGRYIHRNGHIAYDAWNPNMLEPQEDKSDDF